MNHILVVDDEPGIRALIRIHLEPGYQVIEAESGREALKQMKQHKIELIILDLLMDDMNGFELLKHLRTNGVHTLVIALSARREVQDKVEALGLGADDYMTKPFSPLELMARVQAQFRRYRPQLQGYSEVIRLNDLILDIDNLRLEIGKKRYTLTEVECKLLQLFMRNPDRVLTKREIYQQVWNHENYDSNNLSVFISRLRGVLGDTAGSPIRLQSVRGVGYRFSGDGR